MKAINEFSINSQIEGLTTHLSPPFLKLRGHKMLGMTCLLAFWVMEIMGFMATWKMLFLACISSVRFSIFINGVT